MQNFDDVTQLAKGFSAIGRAGCIGVSTFALALACATPAFAQEQPANEEAASEDILVTGSRIKSSFEQPTPVAAVREAALACVLRGETSVDELNRVTLVE